jgi:hypothetical protein
MMTGEGSVVPTMKQYVAEMKQCAVTYRMPKVIRSGHTRLEVVLGMMGMIEVEV